MTKRETPFYDIDGEEHCDEAMALSEMLANGGLLFVASKCGPFFEPSDKDKDTEAASIWVNCNDQWAWACADAEPLPEHEIGLFYKCWKSGNKYATTLWSCKRRNMQPQLPIRADIRKAGLWGPEWECLEKNPDEKPAP